MNGSRPYREAITLARPNRSKVKGENLGASRSHRTALFRLLVFATLLLISCRSMIAASAPPSDENGATIFRNVVVQAIDSHLSSLGIGAKFLPSADQLEILSSPSVAGVDLKVVGLYWDTLSATLYFRIACGSRNACAPFLVRAHIPLTSAEVLRQQFRPDQQTGHAATLSNSHKANRCQQASLLVRAGRPATLLLRRQNMKLTTTAISLECGIAGQQVRARTKKTNKLIEAQVVGENLLAATF